MPSVRLRACQSGLKQGLFTRGGLLHTFSLVMSLTTFVITSVMLGYQSVFLVPIPLTITAILLFVVKSAVDREFRAWDLGPKVSHCLLGSIFPISSPRMPTQVNLLSALHCYFNVILSQDAEKEADNKFTARIKISGPEQFFSYILHLVNLLIGIAVFTILTEMVPSYAAKMKKVEAASGVSMAMMIYVVGPTALGLSSAAKVLYHSTSETWKTVEGGEKWTGQQFIPNPKGKIKLKKMTIPEAEPVGTVPAEVNEILETIQQRRN